jgi:hypothetical protein
MINVSGHFHSDAQVNPRLLDYAHSTALSQRIFSEITKRIVSSVG